MGILWPQKEPVDHWYADYVDNINQSWLEAKTVGELITLLERFDDDMKVYGVGGGSVTISLQDQDPGVLWFE